MWRGSLRPAGEDRGRGSAGSRRHDVRVPGPEGLHATGEASHKAREVRGEARDEARGEAPQGSPGEPPLNERQKWIVAEYLAGRRPSNKDIQKANKCSRATAAKDVKALRSQGIPELGAFDGPLQDDQLLSERQVLRRQGSPAAKEHSQERQDQLQDVRLRASILGRKAGIL